MSKKNLIYLTYDGVLEPLGISQILPYILKLSKVYNITLYSFEKKDNLSSLDFLKNKKILNKNNIKWNANKYYNKYLFITNLINIIFINLKIFFLILKNKNLIFHLRSYTPFFFIIGPLFFFKINYIFDMRGFWLQEKIDRRGWNKNSLILKFLNSFEKKIIKLSHKTLCLTNHSIKILLAKYPQISINKYECIRTTADINTFKYIKKKINYNELKFCYLGTTDGAYNFEKVIQIFLKIKKYLNNAKINIITKDDPIKVEIILSNYNINISDYQIINCEHSNICDQINNIDLGIFYLNNNKSIKASFPTKIAEFFLCNKPILCNNFNYDMESVTDYKRGLLFDDKLPINEEYIKILKKLINDNLYNEYCRKYAIKNLTLDKIFVKILKCYQSIV